MTTLGLALTLPDGWSEHPNPGGPTELRPVADGSAGVLQVSMFPQTQLEFVRANPDLGALAGEIGTGLGEGWGAPSAQREFSSRLGRIGLATFPNGEFPVMLLLVSLAPGAAYLWTWLGPILNEEALGIVMNADLA